MKTNVNRHLGRVACLALLLCIATSWTTANADVTIKQTVSSKGLGGLLNTDMTIETMISGDRQCENSEVMMSSQLMAMFGGNEPIHTSTITRLDKDLIWEIMHADESYSEESLSEKRARMEQFKEVFGDEDMDSDENGMGMSSDEIDWDPPKFDVQHTGVTEMIAGRECKESIVTMDMEGTEKETDAPVKLHLTMDLFLAKDVPGLDEMMAFSKKEAAALGQEDVEEESPAYGMIEMLSEFGVDSKDLVKEAEKLDGFPFRMTVEMRGEGGRFDENPSGMSEEDQAKMEEAMEAMKSLGDLFGADESEEADDAEDAEDTEEMAEETMPMEAESDGTIFKVTTEVTEYSTDAVQAASFEPPSTYKKISAPGEDTEE